MRIVIGSILAIVCGLVVCGMLLVTGIFQYDKHVADISIFHALGSALWWGIIFTVGVAFVIGLVMLFGKRR